MRKKWIVLIAAACLMLAAGGCKKDESSSADGGKNPTATPSASAEAPGAVVEPQGAGAEPEGGYLQLLEPQPGDMVAIMTTNKGVIKIRLFPQFAPLAVDNFVQLAQKGYYNDVIFHRVINDFMIQGGDPTGTGRGGDSVWGKDFEDEFSPQLHNIRGALSMANAGANTNSSQFFIVQQSPNSYVQEAIAYFRSVANEDISGGKGELFVRDMYQEKFMEAYLERGGAPGLDYVHTVFGQVYEGMDIVDAIAAVQTDEADKPVDPIIIQGISIEEYK